MTLTRTPLRQRSDAKQRADAERSRLIAQYRREGRDQCEVYGWLMVAYLSDQYGTPARRAIFAALRECHGRLEGIHERRKRSDTGSLTNRRNLLPSCNACNRWVEDWPDLARAIGLVVRRGDPEWEELAA